MEINNSNSQEIYASELQGDSSKDENYPKDFKNNQRKSGSGTDKEIYFGLPGNQPFVISAN